MSAAQGVSERVADLGLDPSVLPILSELRASQLIDVIKRLQTGQDLMTVLNRTVASTVQRIHQTVHEQYDTYEETSQRVASHPSSIERGVEFPLISPEAHVLADQIVEKLDDRLLRLAQTVPLRLTGEERILLQYLEATLNISEYTDIIDVLGRESPVAQMTTQIHQICSILSGLLLANRYDVGQKVVKNRSVVDNAAFFQNVFEIGRRYKMTNPDKMRTTYGKLLYVLMDTRIPRVADRLRFDCVIPIKTVASLLAGKPNGPQLLRDPLFLTATQEVYSTNRSHDDVQKDIQTKQAAARQLAEKYAGSHDVSSEAPPPKDHTLTASDIARCIESFSDYNNFLRFNRESSDKMISLLETYFDPRISTPSTDLSIYAGVEGSRLTHSHDRQFRYCYQSLCLWREVMSELIPLWASVEEDLLGYDNLYSLRDTGQGLNRVQHAPQVYRHMNSILNRIKTKLRFWDGSSAIHLGDHTVPNAFMFIDKYTQVPRILNPIVLCVESLPKLVQSDPALEAYVNSMFGGEKQAM